MDLVHRPAAVGRALSAALLVLCAPPAAAADHPEPDAPGAAAGGRILFASRFGDGETDGLTFDRAGVWTLADGRLRAQLRDAKQARSFAYLGSEEWTDYAVELEVCGVRGVDKGVAVRVEGRRGVAVDLRGDGYDDVVLFVGRAAVARAPAPNRNGACDRLRVEVRGGRYRVFVGGDLKIDHTDPRNERPRGRVALVAYTGAAGRCTVLYDNVVVRTLDD